MPSPDPARLELLALPGLPMVRPGDDLPALLLEALGRAGLSLEAGDVLVVAQKIVSKAEGRLIALADVTPSERACELAALTAKDARVVELVLRESREVLRAVPNILIVVHRLGFVCAHAGVDASNVIGDDAHALLLPVNPDASAAALREAIAAASGIEIGIVINDSFGRAWRKGTVGVAIGAAGLPALTDLRGAPDLFGRPLQITEVGTADELASAASLLQGQADEGRPAVLIRGFRPRGAACPAAALIRPTAEDLFR